MDLNNLNVVFIGQQTFPEGAATSKRRRYMVDYLNSHNIACHVLVTFYHGSPYKNPDRGMYGATEFVNINGFIEKKQLGKYYKEGKSLLKKWFNPCLKNVLIFPTVLTVFDFPFYHYAKSLGYAVVFDQVETSYLKSGKLRMPTRLYYYLNEVCSKIAYRKSASFVISSALLKQNRKRYPSMPLELLPNSTPVMAKGNKTAFNKVLQILYSGTYGEKEGVGFLIEGVLQAISKGCECRLVLLGKAPDALKAVYADNDAIDFKGFVSEEELKTNLLNSDILAMVRTNSEFANYGFPFKLSEYLSTGNVVVATRVGDVCNYLIDRKDAYIIEPESSKEVCDIILHIKENPEEALQIASNGLETMKSKFSVESVGETFVDFLAGI